MKRTTKKERGNELFERIVKLSNSDNLGVLAFTYGLIQRKFSHHDLDAIEDQIKYYESKSFSRENQIEA